MAVLSYHEQEMIENTKKLRKLIRELPPFCADFFRGIEPRTSSRTRIAYAYDLSIFFDFLIQTNPIWKNKDKRDFTGILEIGSQLRCMIRFLKRAVFLYLNLNGFNSHNLRPPSVSLRLIIVHLCV